MAAALDAAASCLTITTTAAGYRVQIPVGAYSPQQVVTLLTGLHASLVTDGRTQGGAAKQPVGEISSEKEASRFSQCRGGTCESNAVHQAGTAGPLCEYFDIGDSRSDVSTVAHSGLSDQEANQGGIQRDVAHDGYCKGHHQGRRGS